MATATVLSPSEEAQLLQTIEMFEVITQSQPTDYQSLEILKEAYSKLGRDADVINTSKRIAQAYVQLGQFSSAILEYETILQRAPDDPDVRAALQQIEAQAGNLAAELPGEQSPELGAAVVAAGQPRPLPAGTGQATDIEDGRQAMYRIFVESKLITAGDFDLCWQTPDLSGPSNGIVEPFIQRLADKGILPVEKSLKVLCDKSRSAFLPLDKYDVDLDLTRNFPAEICRRWCVLPFDRMSKSLLVATANPYNQQAARELGAVTPYRLVWYLASPVELVNNLRKAFR
jgi:hypothetical protein